MTDRLDAEPVDDMARDSLHVLAGLREQAHTARDLRAYVAYDEMVREIERLRAVAAAAGRVYRNAADEHAWDVFEALASTGYLDTTEPHT